MKNESYRPHFDTGNMVVTPWKTIGTVEPSSQSERASDGTIFMHYRIKYGLRQGGGLIEHVYGEKLRSIKRSEYWWHRNPETGTLHVGRTPWYEWIGQFAASLFVMWTAFAWLDAREMDERIARYILLFIGTARILAMIIGVENNYKLNTKR